MKSISGVWTTRVAGAAIVPLDTHVIRLGPLPAADALHQPGLADGRRHHARAAARSIPDDPVRFDFALCHVGMMGACGFGRPQGSTQCPLKGQCHPRPRRSR